MKWYGLMKQYCFVAKSIQSKWGQNILTSSVNERKFWGDFAFKQRIVDR